MNNLRGRGGSPLTFNCLPTRFLRIVVLAAFSVTLMKAQTDFAARSAAFLRSSGLTLDFSHTSEWLAGTHASSTTPLAAGLTDLRIGWHPNARGLLGSSEFTAIYSAYSQSRRSELPDLQGISNITAPPFHRWREVYWELPVRKALRIKVGKVDANTEFAVVESAGDLSNASAGVSPTLFTMPSYPDGALSASAFGQTAHSIDVGAGVFRSLGGGLYSVGQAGVRWRGGHPGRIAAGLWNQRAGTASAQGSGSYFVVEQTLVPLSAGRGVRAFARFSTAGAAVAPAETHGLYGVSWTGIGRRERDSVGLAYLRLLPAFEGVTLQPETAIEAYYRMPLARYVHVKMDVQHVRRPGGAADAQTFAVASVRLCFNWSTAGEADN